MRDFDGQSNESEVRAEVEKRLARPLSDDMWTWVKGGYYGDADVDIRDPDAKATAAEIAQKISEYASVGAHSIDTNPPKSWVRYSEDQVRRRYTHLQYWVQGALGLRGFIKFHEIHGLLQNLAKQQQSDGAPIDVFYYAYYREGDHFVRYRELVYGFKGQPLGLLSVAANEIAEDAAIAPEEAIEYLLADHLFMLPWLRARRSFTMSTNADTTERVFLTVGSLEVRPEEVAAFYASVRRRFLESSEREGLPRSTYTRSADTHAEMIAFIDERVTRAADSGRLTQMQAAEEWLLLHPEERAKPASIVKKYRRSREGGS